MSPSSSDVAPADEVSSNPENLRSDAAAALRIEHLSHSYGQRQALADLSLEIRSGEIFSMLGPNGSGKTTLFRVLSTLVTPQTGRLFYRTRESQVPLELTGDTLIAIRQRIGVVFQSPSLDVQLTASENLRHHGHLYSLRGAELSSRIDELLRRMNLHDRAHEYVKNFSGGMRRRVELAKALLTRPDILLLDEPSTGLDPGARIDLWRLLKEIRSSDGVTIVLTTHLMDEADQSDRLAVMDRGKLVALGTPAELKSRVGGDVIILTTPDPTRAAAVLHERLGLESQTLGNTLRVERNRGHELIPQLIEALPGMVQSVSLGKPTLEDVFIQAKGHDFATASANSPEKP
jgi:ABC-2 type transport system ATP-binding protein